MSRVRRRSAESPARRWRMPPAGAAQNLFAQIQVCLCKLRITLLLRGSYQKSTGDYARLSGICVRLTRFRSFAPDKLSRARSAFSPATAHRQMPRLHSKQLQNCRKRVRAARTALCLRVHSFGKRMYETNFKFAQPRCSGGRFHWKAVLPVTGYA